MRPTRYRAYFRRPVGSADLAAYGNDVLPGHTPEDTRKFIQLYRDCFSHHIQPGVAADRTRLDVLQGDPKRIIASDNLTARFIHSFYVPPKIYITPNDDSRDRDDSPLSYDEFVAHVTATPILKTYLRSQSLGSNRFGYLIGDVGMGKTMLVTKIFNTILEMEPDGLGMVAVPVYIDFERLMVGENHTLKDINDDFFRDVLHATQAAVHRYARYADRLEGRPFDELPADPPQETLRRYCWYLASCSLRLVILLDNTDRYHFYYSKHSFFDDTHQRQWDAVKRNFSQLINAFTDTTDLGAIGACVLLACRKYVFEDCRRYLDAVNPQNPVLRDHDVFQIGRVDETDAVECRFDLLKEAILRVDESGLHGMSKSFSEQLTQVRLAFMNSLSDDSSPGLRLVYSLSHHALRSFIEFLGAIRLDYRTDFEIVERLFKRQPYNLVRLYMTNLKKRYAQELANFPNLFLNDAVISPKVGFESHYRPHVQTYWLKYLILKFVVSQPRHLATFSELYGMFVDEAGYEEHLFLLALGSLCMASESRCLNVEYTGGQGVSTRRVRATPRGEVLIRGVRPNDQRAHSEFCFEVEYLQVVTDDYFLSLPTKWYEDIYVEADLDYSLRRADAYGRGSWEYLQAKAPAVLTFLRVLVASFDAERKKHPRLLGSDGTGATLAPDFDRAIASVLTTYERVLGHFANGPSFAQRLRHLWAELASDHEFDQFFDRYHASGVMVEAE